MRIFLLLLLKKKLFYTCNNIYFVKEKVPWPIIAIEQVSQVLNFVDNQWKMKMIYVTTLHVRRKEKKEKEK